MCMTQSTHAAVKFEGYDMSKTSGTLDKKQALVGSVVKVARRQPGHKKFKIHGDNIKRLKPAPSKLNQAWVGDVTYLK